MIIKKKTMNKNVLTLQSRLMKLNKVFQTMVGLYQERLHVYNNSYLNPESLAIMNVNNGKNS